MNFKEDKMDNNDKAIKVMAVIFLIGAGFWVIQFLMVFIGFLLILFDYSLFNNFMEISLLLSGAGLSCFGIIGIWLFITEGRK